MLGAAEILSKNSVLHCTGQVCFKENISLNLGLKYANKIKMKSRNVSQNLTLHSPLAPSSFWGMLSYFLRQQINTVASSREIEGGKKSQGKEIQHEK
jgi:hypothetical protein